MDLTIVAVYTISDDFLISLGHQEHPQTQMTDAEVMTTALVAARYFAGNPQTACAALKTLGYIPNMLRHSRYNRRLHRLKPLFEALFDHFAETAKSIHSVPAVGFELKLFLFLIATNIKMRFEG